MKKIIPLIIFLLSCSEIEQGFDPSDDPLVEATFENLLSQTDIEYTKNANGYFMTSSEGIEKMRKLSDKAHNLSKNKHGFFSKSKCQDSKAESFFKNQNITFVTHSEDNQTIFTISGANAQKYEVIRYMALFEMQCNESV